MRAFALGLLAALLAGATLEAANQQPAGEPSTAVTAPLGASETAGAADEVEGVEGGKHPPRTDPDVEPVEHDPGVFRPDPSAEQQPYDAAAQRDIYGAKRPVKTARPPIELGRKLYVRGALERGGTWLGEKNPTAPHLMVYGDLRTALAYNDDGVPAANGETPQLRLAARLNLDLDLAITSTERLHFFVRPFDEDGSFTRWDIDGKVDDEFTDELDFELETAFFEGELGPMVQGLTGRENKIDLAVAGGLMPLLTQNGIWLEDAFLGFGFTIPAFSSRALDASNIDLTFFAGFDRVSTGAVAGEHAADLYGVATFIDANSGYWEMGWGYLDADQSELSYHNVTVAFTRRYGGWLSNSVRLIGNFGQDAVAKTADGALLLIESSLITHKPLTLVPYANFFVGMDQPQPLAKAADAGGVLENTGINFETDGLTGFAKLDDRGHNAWGGALGLQYLFNLDRQVVFEVASLQRLESDGGFVDDQWALGFRFQQPITNAWIVRFDAIHAWSDLGEDLAGLRVELRRKF